MFTHTAYVPYHRQTNMVDGYPELGNIDGLFSSIKNVVKTVAKPVVSVVKSAAPIALPIAGAALAPLTGGASMAVASIGMTAMQAKAQQKEQERAEEEQERYIEQVNAQAVTMGLDPYANAYGLTTAGTNIGSNLVPVQDPVTGKITYIPQQSFFEEYKTPILIGGFVVVGGVIVYLLTRK